MNFFKILLIIFGIFFMLVGVLLWSVVLSHKYYDSNWENWDGKLHSPVIIMCSAPLGIGIIIIAIASQIKRKNSK